MGQFGWPPGILRNDTFLPLGGNDHCSWSSTPKLIQEEKKAWIEFRPVAKQPPTDPHAINKSVPNGLRHMPSHIAALFKRPQANGSNEPLCETRFTSLKRSARFGEQQPAYVSFTDHLSRPCTSSAEAAATHPVMLSVKPCPCCMTQRHGAATWTPLSTHSRKLGWTRSSRAWLLARF